MQPQHATLLTGLAAGAAGGAAVMQYLHLRRERAPEPRPTFALQRYLRRFYAERRVFALRQTDGALVARLRISPGASETFDGAPAATCEVALSLRAGNAEIAAHATTFALDPDSGRLLGCRAERAHGRFTRGGTLPDDAALGAAGEFYAVPMYDAPEATEPAYTLAACYEVIEHPAFAPGRALLRVDTRYEGREGPPTVAQTVLYGIDVAGGIDIRRTILYLPGRALTFGAA